MASIVVIATMVATLTSCATPSSYWTGPETLPAASPGETSSVEDMSCPADGGCVAVGLIKTATASFPGVAAQNDGTWQPLQRLSGTNEGDAVGAVACSSLGNCLAGGSFDRAFQTANSAPRYGLVAQQVNGVWQPANGVFGLDYWARGTQADVYEISCPSDNNCVIAGSYGEIIGPLTGWGQGVQLFAAAMVNGEWERAQGFPSLESANLGGIAEIRSLSCSDARNCTITGTTTGPYLGAAACRSETGCYAGGYTFILSLVDGTWGAPFKTPSNPAEGIPEGSALINSTSCPSRTECVGVGSANTDDGGSYAITIKKSGGTWGKPTRLQGASLSTTSSRLLSISCFGSGLCVAGGESGGGMNQQSLLVVMKDGEWQEPQALAELTEWDASAGARSVNSVSCSALGNCLAAGGLSDSFVASYTDGEWSQVLTVMAPTDSEAGTYLRITDCSPNGYCAAAGTSAVGSIFLSTPRS